MGIKGVGEHRAADIECKANVGTERGIGGEPGSDSGAALARPDLNQRFTLGRCLGTEPHRAQYGFDGAAVRAVAASGPEVAGEAEVMADRLFGAAVSYLITAMEKWGQHLELCAGRLVDLAVHNFILDAKHYRDFCHRHFGGKFLEHIPEIAFKYDGSVERTAKVIADTGYEVDWARPRVPATHGRTAAGCC